MIAQPEHIGLDFFDNEILVGDEVVEFDGDIVLRDNLYDYLAAKGFEFKTV
jgi:hypothetical protein